MKDCDEIQELRGRTRRLERYITASAVLWLLTVTFAALWAGTERSHAEGTEQTPQSLRVSEIIVVDKKGVERVRIGGELPDAIIGGKKVPRGQQAAGVLLYDAAGGERSGYVTFEPSGNVGLTLDSKTAQVASFVAGPEGDASAFSMWTGRNMVELRSDSEGARFTAVRNGEVAVQHPSIASMSADMCAAYKNGLKRVSSEQVMRDCRRRFTAEACAACLGPR